MRTDFTWLNKGQINEVSCCVWVQHCSDLDSPQALTCLGVGGFEVGLGQTGIRLVSGWDRISQGLRFGLALGGTGGGHRIRP